MNQAIPRLLARVLLGAVLGVAPWSAAVGQAAAGGSRPAPAPADVDFLSGMISHHAQAVLIAGWAPTHDASAALRTLCARIIVSQRDEIATMERWLREHGQPVPPPDPRGLVMPGMDHPMAMPGMLTAAQLAQLDSARGAAFDRLFLTFMIQHHRGALTMVGELLDRPNSARDGAVFQIASDINADQTVEIARMTRMLDAMPQPQRSPQ